VIIDFLEDIMERFGCLNRIVTDNVASFRAKPLVMFCEQFRIALIHSTLYYPQGNGLAKSSNKSLINIIKILLEDNRKACDSKLKFYLWVDRLTMKRSLGPSPFHLVYRIEAVFPPQLVLPMHKFFHDYQGEPDDMIRSLHQLVET
jgi:transposase InsO family protein